MVRTIELILGLAPMTQFDAASMPMFNCFGSTPQSIVYTPQMPKIDMTATNKPEAPGAQASAKMDFDYYDEAPEDELNRILWLAMKGPDEPYSTPIHRAVFVR